MKRIWGLIAACFALAFLGYGASSAAGGGPIPPDVADRLADQADRVAELLESGDTCGAAKEADSLQTAINSAISSGEIPDSISEKPRDDAGELAGNVSCDEPPTETQTTTTATTTQTQTVRAPAPAAPRPKPAPKPKPEPTPTPAPAPEPPPPPPPPSTETTP
jgi:outer membrane biosynthesis protein TonB